MGKYEVMLTNEQERFLDLYLKVCPLREEHTRKDYPGLIANNFINSMMKRKVDFLVMHRKKFGEDFDFNIGGK